MIYKLLFSRYIKYVLMSIEGFLNKFKKFLFVKWEFCYNDEDLMIKYLIV